MWRSQPRTDPVEVTLYGKPGCRLCEEMRSTLERASRGIPIRVEEIDITSDPELLERYGEEIPVLLINGRQCFRYRAPEKELRRRLLRG